MPRKPINLELVGGKGLRQRMWDRIRQQLGKPFSLDHLITGAEIKSLCTAREYLTGLHKAGYVEQRSAAVTTGNTAARAAATYVLVRDVGIEAPRVRKDGTPVTMGLRQEQMWRTLRMLKTDVNARELAAYASTPDNAVSDIAASDYLDNLHRASYLQCTQEAKRGLANGGRTPARYRLISDTGPRPPMVCRTDAVYDPNLSKIIWVKPVTEEEAIYGR